MTDRTGELLVVNPDGTYRFVANSYEGIKDGLNQATFDFVKGGTDMGCYLDDEGMFKHFDLNLPISMMFGRPLWGPCVLCHGVPDDEGDTIAPNPDLVRGMIGLCDRWRSVLMIAADMGQIVVTQANDETLPPPTVIGMTREQFDAFLATGKLPD